MSAPQIRRHFLPWDRPLPAQAAAWLAHGWHGDAPLDLSGMLVVVPTRQSGRRLREALAEHASACAQGVFAPRVLTPEALLAPGAEDSIASRLESLLAWTEIFRGLDLDEFRAVLPVDPPSRSFAWAFRLANEFARLQAALAEAGLGLSEVSERVAADIPEAERWRQIGELGLRHAARLAALGLRDAQAARIAAAQNPPALAGVERIVLLATPDPMLLALTVLTACARTLPVDVVVYAPVDEAGNFDGWGRPLPSAWEHRVLMLPEFEGQVHLCADPAAQAARIAEVARGYESPDGLLGVGTADAEVTPLLEGELLRSGLPAFNPEGRLRRRERLYHLLAALAELARDPTFEAVETLARCPDFLDLLRARFGASFSAARCLAGFDELRAHHLPASLAAARERTAEGSDHPEASRALEVMEELRAALNRGTFAGSATEVMSTIFSAHELDLAREADARFEDAAMAWTDVLRECTAAAAHFPGLATAEWWDVALKLFGDGRTAEDKPAGAIELQGWLELLWEDAPHLVVAGFNDGRVPEAVVGDAFLPESLREKLGLKTNAARFARDAYILQALAASHSGGGRLDLLFGKTSVEGEPLRPSRLLLRCPDTDLPARVGFLFRTPKLERTNLPWTRAWQLKPRQVTPPARVAVTALRKWLECPFRFYLRHVLQMQAVDPTKSELDALDFGTLCHGALEAMGGEPALRDCTEAAVLREFLFAQLDEQVRRRFGRDTALPLIIQLESARQRLSKAAAVQAWERANGWIIEQVEKTFALELGGLIVSGKIDRIERHERSGTVRVLDYKTSDRPVAPADAHLRTPRRDETPPEWASLESGGRRRVWSDLQLPLYIRALAMEYPGEVSCGYFNLPKTTSETGVRLWTDYSTELHTAAIRCAEGVCAAIRAGEFWPPAELHGREAERDDFAPLFHHGAAASVAWKEKQS
jgi:ATP-dependent helicase/nuclease subunit B